MTLRTITFDDSTHKIVPREPIKEQLASIALNMDVFSNKGTFVVAKEIYDAAIAAAPEYQEPEQLCDDGGKCGAGGYCKDCTQDIGKDE